MSTFDCPECGSPMTVRYLQSGETAECKNCGAAVIVPADGEDPVSVPHAESPGRPKNQSKLHESTALFAHKTLQWASAPQPRDFVSLRVIAAAYRIAGVVVAILFGLAALIVLFQVGDYSLMLGLAVAIMLVAIGGVLVLFLFAYGDVILVYLSIEKNARLIRETIVPNAEDADSGHTDPGNTKANFTKKGENE